MLSRALRTVTLVACIANAPWSLNAGGRPANQTGRKHICVALATAIRECRGSLRRRTVGVRPVLAGVHVDLRDHEPAAVGLSLEDAQ
jgi:hypothetical protein